MNTEPSLRLSEFIASSPLAIARLSKDGNVLECNQSLRELVKGKVSESGWVFSEIVAEENRADVLALIEKIHRGHAPEKKPLEITLGAGEAITASCI